MPVYMIKAHAINIKQGYTFREASKYLENCNQYVPWSKTAMRECKGNKILSANKRVHIH
jgi:hypothetical protein